MTKNTATNTDRPAAVLRNRAPRARPMTTTVRYSDEPASVRGTHLPYLFGTVLDQQIQHGHPAQVPPAAANRLACAGEADLDRAAGLARPERRLRRGRGPAGH
jgi:hypothetical protein